MAFRKSCLTKLNASRNWKQKVNATLMITESFENIFFLCLALVLIVQTKERQTTKSLNIGKNILIDA